jgi:hypothetical protein
LFEVPPDGVVPKNLPLTTAVSLLELDSSSLPLLPSKLALRVIDPEPLLAAGSNSKIAPLLLAPPEVVVP